MTQFLLSVHGSVDDGEFGPYASEEEMMKAFADTGAFNERLQASGHWVFGGGLERADKAVLVDGLAGGKVVTDGPYLESKEHIGGFWIIDVPDLETAIALAAEGSFACRNKVEVRPFQGV